MRFWGESANKKFRARVIAGNHAVLMALDCAPECLKGFRGFAFHRRDASGQAKWLTSLKVFKSVVPNPKKKVNGKDPVFYTDKHPVQSFLWGDYTARPGTRYELEIRPMYGDPASLTFDAQDVIKVPVQTEQEVDPQGHSIWFNRGAIASQYFTKEFGDIKPSTQQLEDLTQPVTRWLSRGLAEACLRFINETQPGQALRAGLYELSYKPVLNAFKAALDRGVDVQICYHQTPGADNAIKKAEIPERKAGRKVLFPRTKPKIPHNKFIVRLVDGDPVGVWTGSTNITPSGFLGQTNVGHQFFDGDAAATYLAYWKILSKDPDRDAARAAVTKLNRHPVELPPANSVSLVFSPRQTSRMLKWYANRMVDACQSIMFTAAFGVNKGFVVPLAEDRDFLRFVLMENRPAEELESRLRADRDLIIAYGAALGEVVEIKGRKRTVRKIKQFGLDRWFREEEHYRKSGNIFFVHTKFLMVDPLSEDPLICTGSANFSDNSLLANDENMLLIRGDRRVADIYLTEFDRIFRHFYFRNVANEIEEKGGNAKDAFLDETDEGPQHWTTSYFRPGAFKTRRREMFFASTTECWADRAKLRPKNETAKEGDTPSKKAGKKNPG